MRELQQALDAAIEAGALLRAEFHRPGGPTGSRGHCPADVEAERLIRARLEAAFPGDAVLGEELPYEGQSRRVWMVDPNDGTISFQEGFRGAAVSIALLVDGRPVLGVVHASTPPIGGSETMAWAQGGPVIHNGRPVHRSWPDALGPEHTVLVSQLADTNSEANEICCRPARFLAVPSVAYRLALASIGHGDVATSLVNASGYDYAGGHALLTGAGGRFYGLQGEPIVYTAHGDSQCHGSSFGGAPGPAHQLAGRDWRPAFDEGTRGGLLWPEPGLALSDDALRDRATGCWLGQLCGDALGSRVEFQSAARIRAAFPDGVRDMVDGGTWNTLAGQPTDDSELALCLARSLVARGGFDEEDVARRYSAWYESDPFDMGGTTRRALSQAHHGAAAARAAANRDSQANGSLMRCSPLGILGWNTEPKVLAGWARADSTLTHPHVVCQDACAVFVVSLAHAIRTGCPAGALWDFAVGWAEAHAPAAAPALRASSGPAEHADGSHQGWVLVALQNAYHQLLTASSLEDGLVRTIDLGGDTDTNAAIAGALLGAVHGATRVPWRWVDRVLTARPIETSRARPRCYWPVDALVLAERLAILGG